MWLIIEYPKCFPCWTGAYLLEDGQPVVIGRSGDCSIIVPESRLSSRHLSVTENKSSDEVTVELLDPLGQLLIDGEQVGSAVLKEETSFSCYGVLFRILKSPPSPPRRMPVLKQGDKADLSAFLSFLDGITRMVNARELLEKLLNALVVHTEADRGFVLLKEGASNKLVPVAAYGIEALDNFMAVSRTVYSRALSENRLVYVGNSRDDQSVASAASLCMEKPRTIICAPVENNGNTMGVIYLDRACREYEASDLSFIRTATDMVAGIIASRTTRNKLLADHRRAVSEALLSSEELYLGKSPLSIRLDEIITDVAPQDVSILLTGETGVGKELAARAIHSRSRRKNGPFIPVNCAALPAELIEAELFGAEKGAFTGAVNRRLGRFELATAGTLFLDEVGELPLSVQVKLLRVLEDRRIVRVGGSSEIPVDFRLICATNRDLAAAVSSGGFRQDFFFRIAVMKIVVPPLRERPDDIIPLALRFLGQIAQRSGKQPKSLSKEACAHLKAYSWPGNIRELRNAIERAAILEKSGEITCAALGLGTGLELSDNEDAFWHELPQEYEAAKRAFELRYFERGLKLHRGKMGKLADAVGVSRSTLYRRLRALGLLKD